MPVSFNLYSDQNLEITLFIYQETVLDENRENLVKNERSYGWFVHCYPTAPTISLTWHRGTLVLTVLIYFSFIISSLFNETLILHLKNLTWQPSGPIPLSSMRQIWAKMDTRLMHNGPNYWQMLYLPGMISMNNLLQSFHSATSICNLQETSQHTSLWLPPYKPACPMAHWCYRLLPEFCCWTPIWLLCHWDWPRLGYWSYRNMIDWYHCWCLCWHQHQWCYHCHHCYWQSFSTRSIFNAIFNIFLCTSNKIFKNFTEKFSKIMGVNTQLES